MSTPNQPIQPTSHTAESVQDILAILNLSLQLSPYAVGLFRHFMERAKTIPPEQLEAYFAETSAKLDAIAAKARAELGQSQPES